MVQFLLFLAGFGDTQPLLMNLYYLSVRCALNHYSDCDCALSKTGRKREGSSLYQSLSNLLCRASYHQILRACWWSLSSYRQTQKHQEPRALVFLSLHTMTCVPAPCIYCLLCLRSASTKKLQCSFELDFQHPPQKVECFSAPSKLSAPSNLNPC